MDRQGFGSLAAGRWARMVRGTASTTSACHAAIQGSDYSRSWRSKQLSATCNFAFKNCGINGAGTKASSAGLSWQALHGGRGGVCLEPFARRTGSAFTSYHRRGHDERKINMFGTMQSGTSRLGLARRSHLWWGRRTGCGRDYPAPHPE